MNKIMVVSMLLSSPALGQWQVGVAKADISPIESVPLAGFGGKTRMSKEIIHPIWLKAMAIKDSKGETSVLVTADLVGLSNKMVAIIANSAIEKYKIPRANLILNTPIHRSKPCCLLVVSSNTWQWISIAAAILNKHGY